MSKIKNFQSMKLKSSEDKKQLADIKDNFVKEAENKIDKLEFWFY